MSVSRFLAAAAILFLAACSKPSTPAAKTPPPPLVWTDELRASVTAFGKRFEQAVAEEDLQFLEDHIDLSDLVEAYVDNPKAPKALIAGLKSGLEKSKANMARNFTTSKITFIEAREANNRPAILIRVVPATGFDYIELELKRADPQSDWLICETYNFAAGMRLSEMLASTMLPAIQELDQSLLERLTQGQKKMGEVTEHLPAFNKMVALVKEGKTEEGLKIWDQLPDSIRRMKMAMHVHMVATGELPGSEKLNSPYHQSMEAFQQAFPDDPSLLLHAIDHRAVLGDFKGTHEAILKLKELVAGDPYLEFLRSFYYLMEENFPEAEARARAWRAEHPEDQQPVDVLFTCGLRTGDFKLLAESLDAYLDLEMEIDLANPELEPFKASPEGKAWLSSQ